MWTSAVPALDLQEQALHCQHVCLPAPTTARQAPASRCEIPAPNADSRKPARRAVSAGQRRPIAAIPPYRTERGDNRECKQNRYSDSNPCPNKGYPQHEPQCRKRSGFALSVPTLRIYYNEKALCKHSTNYFSENTVRKKVRTFIGKSY